MATGSRNSGFQWDNPFHEQEETPAELRKRRKKEAKEKEAKEKEKREAREKEKREAKEREKEAKRKEVKEKEAKRREAKEKEKDLERQKHSSDKNSQGQPHIPDTTDHFGIPNIPVDLDKTWAVFTGEGRKSSAPSDSSLSPPSPQKMESVSVMPNKVHVIASLIRGILVRYKYNNIYYMYIKHIYSGTTDLYLNKWA